MVSYTAVVAVKLSENRSHVFKMFSNVIQGVLWAHDTEVG